MATTLSNLQTQVARDLRDAANAVWSTDELGDLINAGIDALADFYPKEVVDFSTTITSGVYSYALPSTFTQVYKIDIYSTSSSYLGAYAPSLGDSDSGWETHGNVIWLSPLNIPTASYKLRLFGYGRYLQLSASSSTTDMDATGIWAVRAFCKAEGFYALMYDRAKFAQWGTDQTNSDVSATQMLQMSSVARQTWRNQQQRLRRMRK